MCKTLVHKLTFLGDCGTFGVTNGYYRGRRMEIDGYDRYTKYNGTGKVTKKSRDIGRAIVLQPDLTYEAVGGMFGVSRQRVGQIARRLHIARKDNEGNGED